MIRDMHFIKTNILTFNQQHRTRYVNTHIYVSWTWVCFIPGTWPYSGKFFRRNCSRKSLYLRSWIRLRTASPDKVPAPINTGMLAMCSGKLSKSYFYDREKKVHVFSLKIVWSCGKVDEYFTPFLRTLGEKRVFHYSINRLIRNFRVSQLSRRDKRRIWKTTCFIIYTDLIDGIFSSANMEDRIYK